MHLSIKKNCDQQRTRDSNRKDIDKNKNNHMKWLFFIYVFFFFLSMMSKNDRVSFDKKISHAHTQTPHIVNNN